MYEKKQILERADNYDILKLSYWYILQLSLLWYCFHPHKEVIFSRYAAQSLICTLPPVMSAARGGGGVWRAGGGGA